MTDPPTLKRRVKTTDFIRTNITPEGKQLLRIIAEDHGQTITATIEMIVRDYAKRNNYVLMKETTS